MIIGSNITISDKLSPERTRVLEEIATIPKNYVGRLMKVAAILDIQHRVTELIAEFTDFDAFANTIEELPGPISELDIFILIKKDHPQKVTDRYRKEFIGWIGGCLQDIRKERSSSLPLNPLLHVSPKEASGLQLAQKLQQEIESTLGELGVEIRHAIQKNNNAEKGAGEELSQNFGTLDLIGRFLNNLYVEHPPKKSLKAGDDSDGLMLSDEDDDFKTGTGGVDTLTEDGDEESEIYFYHVQTLMFILDWVYNYMDSIFCLINIPGVNVKKVLREHAQCLDHLRMVVMPDLKKLYTYITEYKPYQSIANFDTFGISSLTTIFGIWEQLSIVQKYFESE